MSIMGAQRFAVPKNRSTREYRRGLKVAFISPRPLLYVENRDLKRDFQSKAMCVFAVRAGANQGPCNHLPANQSLAFRFEVTA